MITTTRTCRRVVISRRRGPQGELFVANQFGGTLGGPSFGISCFFRQLRENARPAGRRLDGYHADRRAASRRSLRVGRRRLTIRSPAPPTGRTHAVSKQTDPVWKVGPTAQWLIDHPLPNLPRPDGTMPETNNYFVRPRSRRPVDARQQVQLERQQPVKHICPLQPARFLHRKPDDVRRRAAGIGDRRGNPGFGSGNTYNVPAAPPTRPRQHGHRCQRGLGADEPHSAKCRISV